MTELLAVRPYKNAVMMAPDNELTNSKDFSREQQFLKAEQSAKKTVKVVENVLAEFPAHEKFMLLEYLPREDSNELAELVEYCNFMLKELVQNSVFSSRMVVNPWPT